MNNTIYCDAGISDDLRRRRLFEGQLFVYSPRPSIIAFTNFARTMIEEAFGERDPRTAQNHMGVEQYAALLGKLKPSFIHHPESKRLLNGILDDLHCNLEKTYFDVPRLRTSTSGGYLTTGIAYAWHPHRDTWYSAPSCQINWWLPVYEIEADNAMAFHPRYWHDPVKNSSSGYNYYTWNKLYRGEHVAKLTKEDPRPLPRATEPLELDPQIRLICPVGGIMLFSGAQMHSSVPNTSGVTRFSIDFRTVPLDDARAKRGTPNIDWESTGTRMRDVLLRYGFFRSPEACIQVPDDLLAY